MISLLKIGLTISLACVMAGSALAKTHEVVFLTPNLNTSEMEAAGEYIQSALLKRLEKGDTFEVVETKGFQSIGVFHSTVDLSKYSPRLRMKKLIQLYPEEISQLGAFIRQPEKNQDCPGQINIPNLAEVLALRKRALEGIQIKATIFGNAVHCQGQGISFGKGYPSDAFLRTESPFNTLGKTGWLRGAVVDFIFFNRNYFYNDIQRNQLQRFWSLYFGEQGGQLRVFSSDPNSLKSADFMKPQKFELNPNDHRLVLRISEFYQGDLFANITQNPPPPGGSTGDLEFGVTWDCASCDIDLYGQPEGGKELSYNSPESEQGNHLKDFLQSPKAVNGFETIRFFNPMNIREVKALVNFYAGQAKNGVTGEVRVKFRGRLYFRKFQIPAEQGNGGKGSRNSDPAWLAIKLAEVVGL